jgi:pimeloyl-ACP methyl ester carboxylesterase
VRGCGLLLTTLAVAALAGCGGDSGPKPKPVKAESLPGYVVDADGHKVYFQCSGSGSPTVVFLNGWGEDSSSWLSVEDESSKLTRSCTYDRYGVGVTSQYGQLPAKARDGHDQVEELEQLLDNAGFAKPYVLVGHSWGGALGRLYAGTHDGVDGVVFVDSSAPGQDTALVDVLPSERVGEPGLFAQLRKGLTAKAVDNPEHLDWGKSLDEVGDVSGLGDRPEIVITAGSTFVGDESVLLPVWNRLQDEIAGLSSQSVHVKAPGATHFIQQDNPELVQTAIRAVVSAVRNDERLATCQAIFSGVAGAECVGS